MNDESRTEGLDAQQEGTYLPKHQKEYSRQLVLVNGKSNPCTATVCAGTAFRNISSVSLLGTKTWTSSHRKPGVAEVDFEIGKLNKYLGWFVAINGKSDLSAADCVHCLPANRILIRLRCILLARHERVSTAEVVFHSENWLEVSGL